MSHVPAWLWRGITITHPLPLRAALRLLNLNVRAQGHPAALALDLDLLHDLFLGSSSLVELGLGLFGVRLAADREKKEGVAR